MSSERKVSRSFKRHLNNNVKLKELKEENRQLRRQVNALKTEIGILRGSAPKQDDDDIGRAINLHSQNEVLFSKKRYSSYVFALVRRTSIFYVYSRIIKAVRRYTFLTTTLKILAAILLFVQSSAVFAIAASFSVVYLPFAIIIPYATFMLTYFKSRSMNSSIRKRISNKKIYVFFPPKMRAFEENSFFHSLLLDTAKDQNHFCVIVSPYFFSTRGLRSEDTKLYITARSETDNIIIVRRHYYFSLKKHVLRYFNSRITEIY